MPCGVFSRSSDGATASSLAEARLVFEEFGRPAHTYAPVYTDRNIEEILDCSDHITFNSVAQFERFGQMALLRGISCGLRINPGYSPVETDLYNPCVPGSRLGIPAGELKELPAGVEGLHFHVLCESRPEHLRLALDAVEKRFGRFLDRIKWLNMGGGHLMTHKDYDCDELIRILQEFKAKYPNLRLILEPGSAFTWRTGYLVSTVEDIVENGGVRTAMLDVSFACQLSGRGLLRGLDLRPRPAGRRSHRVRGYDSLYDGQDHDVQRRGASCDRHRAPRRSNRNNQRIRLRGFQVPYVVIIKPQ